MLLPSRFCRRAPLLFLCVGFLGFATVTAQAAPHAEVRVVRHQPCNLFTPDEPVGFKCQLLGFSPAGKATISVRAKDYWGTEAWKGTFTVDVAAQGPTAFDLQIGKLPAGYYQLKTEATGQAADGTPAKVESWNSLGVAPFVNRSAREVRESGYAFGLKWGPGVPNPREGVDAMVKLGMQWTRIIQNQGAPLTTDQMLKEFPMNAIIKVERFPRELYDEQRYGPLADWETKYGRGAWTLKTLPKKVPYQEWLRQQLAEHVPPDQNIFEIWNEPWDKMPPEDFAMLSQWIVEVILKERPTAVIGPNLLGNASDLEYDARVIAAGGLKGMKMVALHPYASSEDREWLRAYRQWLKQKTGHEMDIYITEYGSHSTPEGPARRSEREQARRVVRQSLALYAEGVKAMTPHWIGQSEQTKSYIEDWFGFLHKDGQPKPVLLAHATCARMVDGSRYVGDLWYGPKVGAMLFEKKGVYTLALWTQGDIGTDTDANPPQKQIEVEPGTNNLTLVDMVGKETKPTVVDGKLQITLSEAPLYLVGVQPALEKQASKELRADRFPRPAKLPRVTRVAHRMQTAPTLDGKFDDWKGMTAIDISNPKVAGADCSATAYLGWDDKYLYLGVDVRDNEMLNTEPRAKLYLQDSVELFVTTEPRETGGGFGPHDHQFFLTPASGEGHPIAGEVTDRGAGKVTDIADAKFFATKTATGWAIETAIPWSTFPAFTPAVGAKAALEVHVNDADTSHPRFKLDPSDAPGLSVTNPSTWSLLTLEQ